MRRVLLVAVLVALTTAGAAKGAIVASSAQDAALALSANGSPRVAYVRDRVLFLAAPRRDGGWASSRVARFPAGRPLVAGLEVDARGRSFVLVQDEGGSWLRIADRVRGRWRVRSVVDNVPADAVLGHAGLELDRTGKPAVAYAFRLPDRTTFLRLVTGGSFRTIGITREGFPESGVVPSAAPVRMADGKLRVLETYSARGGGAILWRHTGADWRGLFLSSSVGGTSPVGPVFARASGDAFGAAWTYAGPSPGEFQARLARRPDRPQTDVVHRRGIVEALTLGPQGPELAATEPVGGLAAGLLLAGGQTFELDGRLIGLEAAGDLRHLLVLNDEGLAWYARPSAPPPVVSLSATAGAGMNLSGMVAGAEGGSVTLYRERPGSVREVAGTAPIAADGSFAFVDAPPGGPLFYRAVYREPLSGTPFASLLRRPVG